MVNEFCIPSAAAIWRNVLYDAQTATIADSFLILALDSVACVCFFFFFFAYAAYLASS